MSGLFSEILLALLIASPYLWALILYRRVERLMKEIRAVEKSNAELEKSFEHCARTSDCQNMMWGISIEGLYDIYKSIQSERAKVVTDVQGEEGGE